jgi:hypothetical protein
MNLVEIFSFRNRLSWTRVAGALIIVIASFGFCWSIVTKFEAGILGSTGLIAATQVLKGYQSKVENKGKEV